MHRFATVALALVLLISLTGVARAVPADDEVPLVRMETEEGEILIALFPDLAPHHVGNFLHLAGTGFYDGTMFHRIVPGFVIQGGDPTGTGRGGPGYQFRDEFHDRTS